jgi:hypothetical protein
MIEGRSERAGPGLLSIVNSNRVPYSDAQRSQLTLKNQLGDTRLRQHSRGSPGVLGAESIPEDLVSKESASTSKGRPCTETPPENFTRT